MIIAEVDAYKLFWEKMPEKFNDQLYCISGLSFDCDKKEFRVRFFEITDEYSNLVQDFEEGYYPPELHDTILKGCLAVEEYLKEDEVEEPYTYDDYLADKADQEEWKDLD